MMWAGVMADDQFTLPEKIDVLWPHIEGLVQEALDFSRGEFNTEDIKKFLANSDMQLWVIGQVEGICITELIDYPQKAICVIVLFAGISLPSALPLMDDVIKPWARSKGMDRLRVVGRPGMEKALKGWHKVYSVMECDL